MSGGELTEADASVVQRILVVHADWLALASVMLSHVVAIAVVVHWGGFQAVSDDDFARVTISQGFVEQAKLDPSGTSWLPFPFWLTGCVMSFLGPTLQVAQAVSWVVSCASSGLVFVAARLSGLSLSQATVGALGAALLPHAVWLGAAPIPEGYSAGWCLFALAALNRPDHAPRADASWAVALLGLLAINGATLSRYEAWPVALVISAHSVWRCWRELNGKTPRHQALAELALGLGASLGPVLWLLYGVLHHGDMFFFIRRVTEYKRALGGGLDGLASRLLGYPELLLRAEPELVWVTLVALVVGRSRLRKALPPLLLTGPSVMLLVLIVGELGGGGPTHHPERALLLVWLVMTLLSARLLVPERKPSSRAQSPAEERSQPPTPSAITPATPTAQMATALTVAGGALLLALGRDVITQRQPFVRRNAELEIARLARPEIGDDRVVIDSPDYGFFAIMAGLGAPARTTPLQHHDPRSEEGDPWRDPSSLERWLESRRARWLIVHHSHFGEARSLGETVVQTSAFALVKLAAPGSGPSAARSAPCSPRWGGPEDVPRCHLHPLEHPLRGAKRREIWPLLRVFRPTASA